jgi:hypothetical protein
MFRFLQMAEISAEAVARSTQDGKEKILDIGFDRPTASGRGLFAVGHEVEFSCD